MADTEQETTCLYCTAEFCNRFALILHIKRCESRKGKTEPEESK